MPRHVHHEELGFQIAPMVDIIFLLILFFMCSAGAVKVENELSIKLPGTVKQEAANKTVDEQIVQIEASGQIILNDQPFDSPTDTALPGLYATLKRFKEMSDANQSQALLTVSSAPGGKFQRVIDVLNVCSAAKIQGVTFTVMEGE